jgi:hypothetical protein
MLRILNVILITNFGTQFSSPSNKISIILTQELNTTIIITLRGSEKSPLLSHVNNTGVEKFPKILKAIT